CGARVARHQRAGGEFAADLALPDAPVALIERVLERCGRLDYLVNNAAFTPPQPPRSPAAPSTDSFHHAAAEAAFDPALFDRAVAVNLRAPLALALAAAERASTFEAVVTIGSAGTPRGNGSSAYFVASKGALPTLTRYLAHRLAPRVRVNALLLGLFDTEEIAARGPGFAPLRDAVVARTPMQRLGQPAEAAEVIVYLLAGNSFLTGSVLTLDGGWQL
ncbi:MAG: SDR family NAD(P)-dependent oxidoreductase, partial [Terriglobales bacterium]